jgi:anti-anti-sigma factor
MIEVSHVGAATIVDVREAVDMLSAPNLQNALRTAEATSTGPIVLVLSDCPYCDSACMGLVLRSVHLIGKRFRVVVPDGTVPRRLFAIMGLADQPFVFESLDDALAAET